jgi:hypothetical protein
MLKQGRAICLGRDRPNVHPLREASVVWGGDEEIRRLRSDTERSAMQDVFAFATTLSKPKYNRLAVGFVSSY